MDETRELLQVILGRVEELGARMSGVEKGLADLRGEVTGLRSEVTGLRSEVTGLRSEFNSFRDEMYTFRDEMYSFRNDATGRLERLERRFDYFRQKWLDHDEAIWMLRQKEA